MALSIADLRNRLAGAQINTAGMSDAQVIQTYNSVAQPKDQVNPQTLEPAGGATTTGATGFTSPDYQFVNPAVLDAQVRAIVAQAQAAADKMRLDLIDKPMLQVKKDQLVLDAAKAASEEGLAALGLISQTGGPRNAFKQQAVMHGLNQMGVSKSIDAIAGKYSMPSFQAPQETPEAKTLQTMVEDLRGAGGANAQTGSPLDAIAADARRYAQQGNDFMPPGTSTVTEDAGSLYDRFMQMDQAFRAQNGRRMTEQEWAQHAQTLGLPTDVAAGLARKVYGFFNANGGVSGPNRDQFMGLAKSMGIGYGQTPPNAAAPAAAQSGATGGGAAAPGAGATAGGGTPSLGYPVQPGATITNSDAWKTELAPLSQFTAPGYNDQVMRPFTVSTPPPGMRSLTAPNATTPNIQGYLDAFPNPNKIVGKQWLRGTPDDQQFWLGLGEQKGFSEGDITSAVQRGLPHFVSPKLGLVA